MEFAIGDYIEGTEHCGDTIKKVCAWVNEIRKDEDGFLIADMQCDDKWCGLRSNYIYESLGKIKLIEKQKSRPSFHSVN